MARFDRDEFLVRGERLAREREARGESALDGWVDAAAEQVGRERAEAAYRRAWAEHDDGLTDLEGLPRTMAGILEGS
jgi:hypothetical protein